MQGHVYLTDDGRITLEAGGKVLLLTRTEARSLAAALNDMASTPLPDGSPVLTAAETGYL
jgi:hypothetical protein